MIESESESERRERRRQMKIEALIVVFVALIAGEEQDDICNFSEIEVLDEVCFMGDRVEANFTRLESGSGRRIFLHFEAVDSAFHAWINGVPVGYSSSYLVFVTGLLSECCRSHSAGLV
ncbi:hypothetical protein CsSME_00011374 [Camellia sinensis var. sinensis]